MNERLARAAPPVEADLVGFFGKLPTHGDFVSTAMGRRLQAELDRWIAEGLRALEPALGKDWRRLFHAAPAWRFVVAADIWAPATIAGIFLPSKDRVGRSFPLVIAAQLRNFSGHLRDICEDDGWFTAAEALVRTSQRLDFEMPGFIEGIRQLRTPQPIARPVDGAVQADERPASLWWRMQPDARHGKGFKTTGAPGASDFAKLVPSRDVGIPATPLPPVVAKPPQVPERVMMPGRKMLIDSSHATHPGTRLSLNADALLVSDQPRVFALADGIGDGTSAIEAARIATAALAHVDAHDTLDMLVHDIKGKLGKANGLLLAKGISGERDAPLASVVVAGMLGETLALVWAGDTRCYLLRDGMMRCLSRDHVDIGLRRMLARALGLKQQFLPETLLEDIRSGDCVLLCSSSLARTLPDRIIAEILLETPVSHAAETLIQEGLIANCRENLSAIVIGIR